MLGIFQMNFKVLPFIIWEKLTSSTRINFKIFCHLNIISQSNNLFGRVRSAYFSANENPKNMRSSYKKNCLGGPTKGQKQQMTFKKLIMLGHSTLTTRAEHVWTAGQFWHFIWGKGLNRGSLRGRGIYASIVDRVKSHKYPACQNLEAGLDHPGTLAQFSHLLPSPVTPQ